MKKLREELSLMKKKMSDLKKANKIVENKSVRQPDPVSRPFLAEFPDWNEFKFCTEKKGAYGPSKNECLKYYSKKLAQTFS